MRLKSVILAVSLTVGGSVAKSVKVGTNPTHITRKVRRKGRHCKRLKKSQRTCSSFFGSR